MMQVWKSLTWLGVILAIHAIFMLVVPTAEGLLLPLLSIGVVAGLWITVGAARRAESHMALAITAVGFVNAFFWVLFEFKFGPELRDVRVHGGETISVLGMILFPISFALLFAVMYLGRFQNRRRERKGHLRTHHH